MGEVINGCFFLIEDVSIHYGETRVNIKCETHREGVFVAERLGAYLKAGCETGGLQSLIREHRRQHHVNSLHSSMSAVPCGQRIKATASLIEQSRQHSRCWA